MTIHPHIASMLKKEYRYNYSSSVSAMEMQGCDPTTVYSFTRLYDVSTHFCAHLTIILSSSSSCLCHSSLLPLIPFPPISPLIPSAQVSLGPPRFLLPGGLHFITSFGNLPSPILWTCPYHRSCLVLISSKRGLTKFTFCLIIVFLIIVLPGNSSWAPPKVHFCGI